MKKNAFTLMELLMTVVIIAVLAGITIAYGTKPLETAKGRDAQESLRIIYVAEKEYCINNSSYASLATLETEGYLFLPNNPDRRDWTYTIILTGAGVPPNNCGTFTAIATRTAGHNLSEIITINETGQINPLGTNTWSP